MAVKLHVELEDILVEKAHLPSNTETQAPRSRVVSGWCRHHNGDFLLLIEAQRTSLLASSVTMLYATEIGQGQ